MDAIQNCLLNDLSLYRFINTVLIFHFKKAPFPVNAIHLAFILKTCPGILHPNKIVKIYL